MIPGCHTLCLNVCPNALPLCRKLRKKPVFAKKKLDPLTMPMSQLLGMEKKVKANLRSGGKSGGGGGGASGGGKRDGT